MPTRPAPQRRLDLRRAHATEYVAGSTPSLLRVAPAKVLLVAGHGAPGSPAFRDAVHDLYGTAYALKSRARAAGRDFKVPALEALWDLPAPEPGPDPHVAPANPDLSKATWQLLVRVPQSLDDHDLRGALATLAARGRKTASHVHLRSLREGRCVQALHVGAYGDEWRTLGRMLEAAAEAGCKVAGPHHEIYLDDPRRTGPRRLRTLLRLPVRPLPRSRSHPSAPRAVPKRTGRRGASPRPAARHAPRSRA